MSQDDNVFPTNSDMDQNVECPGRLELHLPTEPSRSDTGFCSVESESEPTTRKFFRSNSKEEPVQATTNYETVQGSTSFENCTNSDKESLTPNEDPPCAQQSFMELCDSKKALEFAGSNLVDLVTSDVNGSLTGSAPPNSNYDKTTKSQLGLSLSKEASASCLQPTDFPKQSAGTTDIQFPDIHVVANPVMPVDVASSTNISHQSDRDKEIVDENLSIINTPGLFSQPEREHMQLDDSMATSPDEETSETVPSQSAATCQQPIDNPSLYSSINPRSEADPTVSTQPGLVKINEYRPSVSRNSSEALQSQPRKYSVLSSDADQTVFQSLSTQENLASSQSDNRAAESGSRQTQNQVHILHDVMQTASDVSGKSTLAQYQYSLNHDEIASINPTCQIPSALVNQVPSEQDMIAETLMHQQKILDDKAMNQNGRKSRFVYVYQNSSATPHVQGQSDLDHQNNGSIPLMMSGDQASDINYSHDVKSGPIVFLHHSGGVDQQVIVAETNGEGYSSTNRQPFNRRQSRPQSEGIVDTNLIYHDHPQNHPQNNSPYHRASRSNDFPPTYQTAFVLQQQLPRQGQSAIASSLSVDKSTYVEDHDNLSLSTVEQISKEHAEITRQSVGPILRDSSGSSIPAGTVVEVIGSIPIVRIPELDGTIIKKRVGRFKFVEGTNAAVPSSMSSIDGVNESQSENVYAHGLNNSGTGSEVPTNQGQSAVRRGRFVVVTMSDPSATPQADGVEMGQVRSTHLSLANENFGLGEDDPAGRTIMVPHYDQSNNNHSSGPSKSQVVPIDYSEGAPDQKTSPVGHYIAKDAVEKSLPNEAISSSESVDNLEKSQRKETSPNNSLHSTATDQNRSKAVEKSSSPNVSADFSRAGRLPYGTQPVGVGKAMYHLHQMQLELTEVDKTTKSLHIENRCLKEKNKELEAKARDWERKFNSEKVTREKLEAKVKGLKLKLRMMKEVVDPDPGKEVESLATVMTEKVSRSSSFEGDNDDRPKSPMETPFAVRHIDTEDRFVSNSGSPMAVKNTIESEANNASPMPHKNLPTTKPPILPMFQKKTRSTSAGRTRTNVGSTPTTKSQSTASTSADKPRHVATGSLPNFLDVIDISKNGMHNSHVNTVGAIPIPGVMYDSNKIEIQNDSFAQHTASTSFQTLGAPPRPPSVNSKSRSDSHNSGGASRVPGSSLTRTFDPFGSLQNHDSPSSDDQLLDDEEPTMHLYTALPSFVIEQKPLITMTSDLIDLNVNSWVETPATDAYGPLGTYTNTQQPLFLIQQSGHVQHWESQDKVYAQQPSMVTYSHPFIQYHDLSRNDALNSQDHSRNPSISLASSGSPQGSTVMSQRDFFCSEDAFLPPTDAVISSDAYQLNAVPASVTGDNDLLLSTDPFDLYESRKL